MYSSGNSVGSANSNSCINVDPLIQSGMCSPSLLSSSNGNNMRVPGWNNNGNTSFGNNSSMSSINSCKNYNFGKVNQQNICKNYNFGGVNQQDILQQIPQQQQCSPGLKCVAITFSDYNDQIEAECSYSKSYRRFPISNLVVPGGLNQLCSNSLYDNTLDDDDKDMANGRTALIPCFSFKNCRLEDRCGPNGSGSKKWLVIEDLVVGKVGVVSFFNKSKLLNGGIALEFSNNYQSDTLLFNSLQFDNVQSLKVDSKKNGFTLRCDDVKSTGMGTTISASTSPIKVIAKNQGNKIITFDAIYLNKRVEINSTQACGGKIRWYVGFKKGKNGLLKNSKAHSDIDLFALLGIG